MEKNLESSKESEKIMMGPNIILTRPKIAHLFLGLENSIFIDSFTGNYEAIYYPGYRKIVENRIKKLSLV